MLFCTALEAEILVQRRRSTEEGLQWPLPIQKVREPGLVQKEIVIKGNVCAPPDVGPLS